MFNDNNFFGGGGEAGFYPDKINQSLRFNDDDSAYLSRTPASAGNRKTWTWSGWVKRGNLNVDAMLFSAGGATANTTQFYVRSNNCIDLVVRVGGSNVTRLITNSVFRDTSAWYHIALSVDTTQSTASDRYKIYVNGVDQLDYGYSTETYSAQNVEGFVNNTSTHYIGRYFGGLYHDGYMAEVNFIDGQALDATSFGETKSGVWIPKAYEGSYGTNGFHLDFGNSADLGNDVSGQGNDWTANNLSATDQVLDSPTNNFATLNPLSKISATLAQGNLYVNFSPVAEPKRTYGTLAVDAGKWYWEFYLSQNSNNAIGVADTSEGGVVTFSTATNFLYIGDGTKAHTSVLPYSTGFATNDIIGVGFDGDQGRITFYKNGVSQGEAFNTIPSGVKFAPVLIYNQTGTVQDTIANFGQDSSFAGNKTPQGNTDANGIGDFYYAPPAGALALCTANLPEPVIGPNSATLSDEHFNTLVWSGDGTNSGRSFTGVGFQPDFMWWKKRSGATVHHLYDSIRGAGNNNELVSNGTGAEGASNAEIYGYLSSFDSDGFTGTAGTDGSFPVDYFNGTGSSYVAWNWKANGSGVSNTDGSITSTVSANTDAGFSIVNWTASGGASTQGHGLSQTPEMIIAKSRDNSDNWWVWFDGYSADEYLVLNGTSAKASYTSIWGETPTSTTFGVTASSFASGAAIAYCFHSVDGFSKFGSYTGNGSTDGPFVFCGFKPAFVMVKRTDATGQWTIWDGERDQHNYAEKTLFPNLSNAEESGNSFERWDLLSNGFKLRSNGRANVSGGTHIFMAFSENPFKYSTGA